MAESGFGCPSCGAVPTAVIDSRSSVANTAIRRRRKCGQCGFRFSTYERIAGTPEHVCRVEALELIIDTARAALRGEAKG